MKTVLTAICLLVPTLAHALSPTLETIKVTDDIHMLSGQGGNIGVMIGADGTFVIDDQMAPIVPVMLKKIKDLGGSSPRFLINTHYHFDHAGGNENVGKEGTTIYSHHNARKRLAEGSEIPAFNAKTPPAPAIALPVVTYSKDMHFHINGDTLRVVHFPNAHTDGDSVIFFEKANTLHTGDIFFNGLYPFIDTHNGGSLLGTIQAVQKLLATIDDDTKIIPGHGPLASKADLMAYQDMLTFANATFMDAKTRGITTEALIAENPLVNYDAKWSSKLFNTNNWIGLMYTVN